MPSAPIPNPGMFKGRKLSGIPRRPQVSSPQVLHAFRGNVIPKGQDDIEVLVDTGILIAVGSAQAINGLKRFGERFARRAFTTETVREEIVNRSTSTSTDPTRVAVRAAAKGAKEYLLNSGRIGIRQLDVVATGALLQRIQDQLVAIEAARGLVGSQDPGTITKHAGEATLVVLAVVEKFHTILTNDSGASAVAASQQPSIQSLHFGDVLRELLCASDGGIDTDAVSQAFEMACSISGITDEAKPASPERYFVCHKDDAGACVICSQLRSTEASAPQP